MMNRRDFLKVASAALMFSGVPRTAFGAPIDFSQVHFSGSRYAANKAQVIMVFLYGGASELAGNLTNIDEIKSLSQSSYDQYFNGVTPTANGFWQEAGGQIMEDLLASGDMNVFRTCFSQLRDEEGNRSHGRCVSQNQRGINDDNDSAGVFSAIANTLYQNNVINENTQLPFLTMEGESIFFGAPDFALQSFLKPTAISADLSNPYLRGSERSWFYYTSEERSVSGYTDQRAQLDLSMDILAQTQNLNGKIKENFDKRVALSEFIDTIKQSETPAGVSYPDNSFAERLETAVKIMAHNPDTHIISLGSDGLGGWDDHNEARDYPTRMQNLMSAIEAAVAHIKAEGKQNEVSIMVWGDFGRNVNLNSSLGWDHGNLQNLYTFCGQGYFNPLGVVGETQLTQSGQINRLYLKPATDSYWFEPYSVAATLYSVFGITNPAYLTGGFDAIGEGLLT